MRGKLSDQDLTNYALNELDPRERLYVESMLAVSAECRSDVYHMAEMAKMLEEGFADEAQRGVLELSADQRQRLLRPPGRERVLRFVNRIAAAAAVAACVAWALAHPEFLRLSETVRKSALPSVQVARAQSAPPAHETDIATFVSLEAFAEDSASWIQTSADVLPEPAVVCTPPSWLEDSDAGSLQ